MIKTSASLSLVMLLATACSTPRTPRPVPFTEQGQANLIVRYYTDDTSYVLKPARRDGRFLTILKQDAVLDVAKQQPDRQLAVVILIHYGDADQAASVKNKWTKSLKEAGYQRVVFLRASGGMQADGLPVMASGG